MPRAFDLRAQFRLDLRGRRVGRDRADVAPHVPVGIEQSLDLLGGRDGPPTIVLPLAGKCQVQPDVEVGMLPRKVGHLGDPRARHHDAGRLHAAGQQRLGGRHVHRMAHAGVVGVDHQELCFRAYPRRRAVVFGVVRLSESRRCMPARKARLRMYRIIRAPAATVPNRRWLAGYC